jgi:hypothetical protein
MADKDNMEQAPIIPMGELHDFLLHTAVVAPVFIWGQPGIGKSAMVEQFARSVGLPCVSLIGTQLAAEDLIGVPRIEGEHSVFSPPRMIARDEPYLLFLDELNGSSPDVQKSFYSLIHDRRLGEYNLPEGSIIIGAGNRATDNAIVRPMSSALINRMIHVGVRVDTDAWLEWALSNDIHPWVYEYIRSHPRHLWSKPPKDERTFSTPRAWHLLSNVLNSYGESLTAGMVPHLAATVLSTQHAQSFGVFVSFQGDKYLLSKIIKGEKRWPRKPDQRDHLHYLTLEFRDQLIKRLPEDRAQLTKDTQDLSYRGIEMLRDLADISGELAQIVILHDEEGRGLPAWYLAEIASALPRLVGR